MAHDIGIAKLVTQIDEATAEIDNSALSIPIADVSGKGVPAALFMAMTRSTVRASVGHAPSPAEGIALANRLICADAAEGIFLTLFYAWLDLESG